MESVSSGESVQERRRMTGNRLWGGAPFSYEEYFLPLQLGFRQPQPQQPLCKLLPIKRQKGIDIALV